MSPDRTVADTVIIEAWKNGATVSDLSEVHGSRPSIQIFDSEPISRRGYNLVRIIPTVLATDDDLTIGSLLSLYDLTESSPQEVPTSLMTTLRAGLLKLGVNHTDEYVIEVASSGTDDEVLAVLRVILEEYDTATDVVDN
jgi:hypothetical protein